MTDKKKKLLFADKKKKSLFADKKKKSLFADKKKKSLFADKKEKPVESGPVISHDKWKILIADDEPEVHDVTKLALRKFEFRDRTLELLHAYSAQEAEQLLQTHPDTAVILLDVVMEADDSGLQLIETIRNKLQNNLVRIILRTGQPGQAPEKKVILEYDINDYKLKTELTSQRLYVTLVTALRSYHDLTLIEASHTQLAGMYDDLEKEVDERKQLERQIQESLKRRTNQVQTSTEVAQDIAAAPALDELFRRVVNLAKDRFGYYYVHVYTLEGKDLVMQEGTGEAGHQMKEAGHKIALTTKKSLVARAVRHGEPILVPDVSQEPDWLPNPLLPETKSELAMPIKLGDEVLGILDVQSDILNGVGNEDQLLLLGLCGQIASAVRSTRLLEEANTFRMFVEASGQGFGMATLDGKITYANPTFCHLIDEDNPKDMYGKSLALYYPTEMRQRILDEIIPAVMDQSQWLGESTLLSTQGKLIPVIENFFLIRDKDGLPLYLADVLTDITESKRTEAELEERIRELNILQGLVSQEGWQILHQTEAVSGGYLYDQQKLTSAADLWLPEIGLAATQKSLISSLDSDQATVAPLFIYDDIIGALGVYTDADQPLTDDELALVEAVSTEMAQALESSRLFLQTQQAGTLLRKRVEELNCLTDIGRKIAESPPLPELLTWVSSRIPAAMQYPDLCRVAIEYNGELYGQSEATKVLSRIVQALRVGSQVVGRIYIAYVEHHDFLDEESALLGGTANRVSSYIESSLLLKQIQRRAEQEHTVRTITDKIRRGADRESILRIARDEISHMLGASNSVVQLGTQQQLLSRLKQQSEPNQKYKE